MNTNKTLLLTAVAFAVATVTLCAQGADRAPRHQEGDKMGPPGHRGAMPLMAVLDANHDGILDAAEIAGSGEALKKLDKDGDGQLTAAELGVPHGRGPGHQARQSMTPSADDQQPLPPRPPGHGRGEGRRLAQLPPIPPAPDHAPLPPAGPEHQDQ